MSYTLSVSKKYDESGKENGLLSVSVSWWIAEGGNAEKNEYLEEFDPDTRDMWVYLTIPEDKVRSFSEEDNKLVLETKKGIVELHGFVNEYGNPKLKITPLEKVYQ